MAIYQVREVRYETYSLITLSNRLILLEKSELSLEPFELFESHGLPLIQTRSMINFTKMMHP